MNATTYEAWTKLTGRTTVAAQGRTITIDRPFDKTLRMDRLAAAELQRCRGGKSVVQPTGIGHYQGRSGRVLCLVARTVNEDLRMIEQDVQTVERWMM